VVTDQDVGHGYAFRISVRLPLFSIMIITDLAFDLSCSGTNRCCVASVVL